ncbi:MAG: response regulator [Angelakisella sp.]
MITMQDVLIVDDDRVILEGLHRMVASFAPEVHIHTATNGNEALEKVCSGCIGIIFTDIKMPVCSGIEMLEKLKKLGYEGETVIISGFDDYEFVRHAMKLGASDYLLKPVVLKELETVYRDCSLRLSLRKHVCQDTQQSSPLKDMYFCQAQLELLLQKPEEVSNFLKALPDDRCACVMALAVDIFGRGSISDMSRQSAALMMQSYIEDCCHDIPTVVIQGEQNKRWITLIFTTDYSMGSHGDALRRKLIHAGFKLGCSGEPLPAFEVLTAYGKALDGLEDFFYDLPSEPHQGNTCTVESLLEGMLEHIAACNMAAFSDTAARFFNLICLQHPSADTLKQSLSTLIYSVMKKNNRFISVVGRYKFTEHDIAHAIQESSTVSYLKKQFISIIDLYISEISGQCLSDDDCILQKIRSLVSQGYGGNLSTSSVSEQLGLHPNYFCALFKQKTGETFTDYLRSVRIKKAMELMATTNLKMYEIALMVGYHDNAHFYRAFKQVSGVSPGHYKQHPRELAQV